VIRTRVGIPVGVEAATLARVVVDAANERV